MGPGVLDTFPGEDLVQRKTLRNRLTFALRRDNKKPASGSGLLVYSSHSLISVFYDKVHAAVLLHASFAVLYAERAVFAVTRGFELNP
jgi:hypothetical protein